MPTFIVKLEVKRLQLETLAVMLRRAFPEASIHIAKDDPPKTRAERLSKAEALISDGRSIVEELRDEMSSTKAMTKSRISGILHVDLQDMADSLESIDFGVNFPQMMG